MVLLEFLNCHACELNTCTTIAPRSTEVREDTIRLSCMTRNVQTFPYVVVSRRLLGNMTWVWRVDMVWVWYGEVPGEWAERSADCREGHFMSGNNDDAMIGGKAVKLKGLFVC